MKVVIIILCVSVFIFFLIKGILRIRDTPFSRLSDYEHPATYKKPDIEMVSGNSEKEQTGSSENKVTLKKEDRRM